MTETQGGRDIESQPQADTEVTIVTGRVLRRVGKLVVGGERLEGKQDICIVSQYPPLLLTLHSGDPDIQRDPGDPGRPLRGSDRPPR